MLNLENVSINFKSWLMHKKQATWFQLQTQFNN
jgi:CCR4-NOT transcriptional regulation complex NOT5 subunit